MAGPETIFLQVVQLGLEAGMVVLAVLFLRLVFRSAPKWLHCLMWGLVAVKLVCPFGIESETSPMPRRDAIRSSVESGYAVSAVAEELPEKQQTVPQALQEQLTEPHGAAIRNHAAQSVAADDGGSRAFLPSAVRIGSWIWLAGMSAMLLYGAVSTVALRRKLADAVPLEGDDEKTGSIYRSDRISSAFLFGIVRPKIYLPFGMEGETMRQVIAHEKAHIRRLDNVTKAEAFVLTAVYWFHPAIWLAYMLYCRDIELACDESVVKGKQTDERKAYSLALLACSAEKKAFAVNSAIPVPFGQSAVRRRVANVLKNKKPAIGLIGVGIVAIIAALIVVITRPADYRTDVPKELDRAIAEQTFAYNRVSMSDLLCDRQYFYAAVSNFVGRSNVECYGEGHKIYGVKESGNSVEVYAMCSAVGYGFRDGMLVDNAGYSCVPTLIRFEKDANGGYRFKDRQEARDGGEYRKSVYEMFPRRIAKQVLDAVSDAERHNALAAELQAQCDVYAAAYLKAIGRDDATVSSYYKENFLLLSDFGVSEEVSNALLALHGDYDLYVGNFEVLEYGKRYVYWQIWSDNKIGPVTVTFQKTAYDSGEVVEEFVYVVEGDKFYQVKPEAKQK